MEKKEGFLLARPEKTFRLHTTHTPTFLGLLENSRIWNQSNFGKGVIIGVLDSGITPNHPSFSDKGMPPPPKKWKGRCDFKPQLCNNKIIGARSFAASSTEPNDDLGHGTYTSSTAAGNFVKGANTFKLANGTAAGMAPLAHIAMYKIGTRKHVFESDILAGMDTAVGDGVDILSISLGLDDHPLPFYSDAIAIGTFSANLKGIFVSCSAGNDGPFSAKVKNGAPWVLTVGASTMDRRLRSTAVLGNMEQYDGETVFQPTDFPPTQMPLIYRVNNYPEPEWCHEGSFSNIDVKGKIVLCEGVDDGVKRGKEVKNAGGAGMILMNEEEDGYSTIAMAHVLPALHVSYAAGSKIKEYIRSTITPTAAILFRGTVLGEKTAPEVTSLSSRGPNIPSPGILKPDIIAPGVNVLAALPYPHENMIENAYPEFQIQSGTSASCPHLSGIAALLKKIHPNWSPAAIKSAMMTTADVYNQAGEPILDERRQPADLFAIGAGHINPSQATDPGLIYDLKPEDYVQYLCGLKFNDKEMEIITRRKVNCSQVTPIPEAELNYPSFSVALRSADMLTYARTVTNVGPPRSSYRSFVTNPPGVEITVTPRNLDFSKANQKLKYEVTFNRSPSVPNATYVQGYLEWSSNTSNHCVRSPISVHMI